MKIRLLILSLASLMLSAQAMAQGEDQFEDDPFAAQQSSMPRTRRSTGWRPAGYSDQQELINSMLQAKIKRSLKYRFESVGVLGSGQYAPFWTTAGRQGLSSVEKKNAYMRYGMFGEMLLPSQFGVKYGMDLGLGTGLQEDWFVQQLYVDLNWYWLGLSFGMKERSGELVNPSLSSGGLTWSGNSKPIPQIRIGIPDYVKIGCLGGWVSAKGHVAYGRYTDDDWRSRNGGKYTDGILHHSKALFLKFGNNERFPLEAVFGLEMYAQFGGTMHNRILYDPYLIYEKYDLPHDMNAYLNILLPFNDAGSQGKENGNSLGSWHLSFDWKTQDLSVRTYYEHFFEDHSGMLGIEYKPDEYGNKSIVRYGMRRNWFDGLYGLELNLTNSRYIHNVVLEFFNSKGQSGPVCNPDDSPIVKDIDGRDEMYNHELYDSYSMYGYTIGNPVLLSPIYNSDGLQSLSSNRVNMYHFGLDGAFGNNVEYQLKCTYSNHWGTFNSPYAEVCHVLSAETTLYWIIGKNYSWKIGTTFAIDRDSGILLGNNEGIMISVVKNWKIL